jgi:hypothetical protein
VVKKLILFLLLGLSLSADEALYAKIESFIGTQAFERNRDYIGIIFSPTSEYYRNNRLDVVKVVETLEENGLLNLFFDEPKQLEMTFVTNGSPLFFVKLMGDTLRDLGYYRYITKEAKNDAAGFSWTIGLRAEYATDPALLRKELQKRSCDIVDIERNATQQWRYEIDISQAHLSLDTIQSGEEIVYKRSLYAHWLDVSHVKKLTLWSSKGNNWYPYVAYYDSSLRLLKVFKRDKKTWKITFTLPRDAAYMKITDLYSVANIKNGLRLEAQGRK